MLTRTEWWFVGVELALGTIVLTSLLSPIKLFIVALVSIGALIWWAK